jgi:hypothetical protein
METGRALNPIGVGGFQTWKDLQTILPVSCLHLTDEAQGQEETCQGEGKGLWRTGSGDAWERDIQV